MKTKMKMQAAVRIWLVIYPSITLFNYWLGGSIIHLPVYARTLIMTVILVPWMVFIAMPLLEKIVSKKSKTTHPHK